MSHHSEKTHVLHIDPAKEKAGEAVDKGAAAVKKGLGL
jgi:hypothetical protein